MKKKIIIPLIFVGVIIAFIIVSLATGFISIKPVEETPIETTESVAEPDAPYVENGFVFIPDGYFEEPEDTEPTTEPDVEGPTINSEKVESFYDDEIIHEEILNVSELDYSKLDYRQYLEFFDKYRLHVKTTDYLVDYESNGLSYSLYPWDDYNTEVTVSIVESDELAMRRDILNGIGLEDYANISLMNPIGKNPKISLGQGLIDWKDLYEECDSDPTINDYFQLLSDFIMDTKYGDVTVITYFSELNAKGKAILQLKSGCVLLIEVKTDNDSSLVAYIEDAIQNSIMLAEIGVDED